MYSIYIAKTSSYATISMSTTARDPLWDWGMQITKDMWSTCKLQVLKDLHWHGAFQRHRLYLPAMLSVAVTNASHTTVSLPVFSSLFLSLSGLQQQVQKRLYLSISSIPRMVRPNYMQEFCSDRRYSTAAYLGRTIKYVVLLARMRCKFDNVKV